MTQSIIEQLETAFCLSIPWTEKPKFSLGDRLFSKHLNLTKEVKGVVWSGNWFYFVPHNGKLFQVSERNCYLVEERYQIAPFPYNAFGLGDRVSCPLRNVHKSLILGIVYLGGWRYYIQIEEGRSTKAEGRRELKGDSTPFNWKPLNQRFNGGLKPNWQSVQMA